MSRVCIGFLAHIMNKTNKLVSDVKDTPIVQEFLDIFLDSLLGLALEKEMVFNIKLTTRTVSIFKASYKMNPVKF